MSKKYQAGTSKIRVPIKQNAKMVMMGDIEVCIPVLSIYHSKIFSNMDANNFYEILSPLVERVYENPNRSQFSFILLKIMEHNKIINSVANIDGELFDLSNVVINDTTKFYVDDVEYEFEQIMPYDDMGIPLEFLSKKLIGDKVDFTARGISFEFMKVFYDYTKDIRIVGSKGNIIEGLGFIVDAFGKEK